MTIYTFIYLVFIVVDIAGRMNEMYVHTKGSILGSCVTALLLLLYRSCRER